MAITKIIVGIDGTGAVFDSTYHKDFEKSFVRRLAFRVGDNYNYQRGPIAPGGGLTDAIIAAYGFVEKQVTSTRGLKDVLLTGYSRGATGVVVLAAMLKRIEIRVRAMLLFDCVDMHLVLDAEYIPENVQNLMHLVRSPEANSRMSWGNDALNWNSSKTNGKIFAFRCTHGAMGGVPSAPPEGKTSGDFVKEDFGGETSVTYAEDEKMSNVIWATVQPFCIEHGFI